MAAGVPLLFRHDAASERSLSFVVRLLDGVRRSLTQARARHRRAGRAARGRRGGHLRRRSRITPCVGLLVNIITRRIHSRVELPPALGLGRLLKSYVTKNLIFF